MGEISPHFSFLFQSAYNSAKNVWIKYELFMPLHRGKNLKDDRSIILSDLKIDI